MTSQMLQDMVKEIETLKRRVDLLATQKELFPIRNTGTVTFGASQNDYDLGQVGILRVLTSSSVNLTGLANGYGGRILIILKVGANNLTIVHNSGSSQAANRIFNPSAADITLSVVGAAILNYSSEDGVWITLASSV